MFSGWVVFRPSDTSHRHQWIPSSVAQGRGGRQVTFPSMQLCSWHNVLYHIIGFKKKLWKWWNTWDFSYHPMFSLRSDFLLKLAQLREHWQGAVQRAAQRRSLVEGLIQHWHLYTHTLQKLRRLLTLAHTLLSPAGPTHCSVLQLRLSLDDLKVSNLNAKRNLTFCTMDFAWPRFPSIWLMI